MAEPWSLSEENDDGVEFDYFISLVLLLSDLCLGRNFQAIHPLSNIYPFEVCFAIIK